MIRQAVAHDRQALFDMSNTSLALDYLSAQDFYFAHCFNPSQVIINEVQGHPVASLQVSYHVMMLHDVRIMVSMFIGLLSDQSDTQLKYQRQLLQQAIDEQSYKTLITLIPTDHPESYHNLGFAPLFHQKHFIVNREDMPTTSYYGTDKNFTINQLSQVYRQFISHFNGYILRDNNYWLKLVDELTVKRLNLAVYHNSQGEVEGYMIYRLAKKQTEVLELVYLNGKAMIRLLSYGFRFKNQLDIAVASEEDLTKVFPQAESHQTVSMCGRINDYKLFNQLFQSQIKDPVAGFALSPKPLFNDERF